MAMFALRLRHAYLLASLILALTWLLSEGCQYLSNRLTHWNMLGQEALQDPVQAVGGHAILFAPGPDKPLLNREQLVAAAPADLVAYYAPLIVQQRVDTAAQPHPYPAEYDLVGEARLKREGKGSFKGFIAGPPTIYAIYQKVKLGDREHVQLTYTAWYPAHPRMKAIDLEEADIDSCVLRLTLDLQNAPLFYETIAACGCFHKVFVEKWIEDAAVHVYGQPESGKKYAVEKSVKDAIDWEVAGVVDSPRDQPCRPVVFIQAGNHHVIGMGSMARLRVPPGADVRPYALTDYADLYAVAVADSQERAPFFDVGKGGKVWGAERKERFIFTLAGVDAAGQPRANDQIKLHFDQSTWSDPIIYVKFLRLPPGTL
jgi:hypothetical protein